VHSDESSSEAFSANSEVDREYCEIILNYFEDISKKKKYSKIKVRIELTANK